MIVDSHAHVVAPSELYAWQGVKAHPDTFGAEKPIDGLTDADRTKIDETNARRLYSRAFPAGAKT